VNGEPATARVLRVGRPGIGFPCREQAITTLIVKLAKRTPQGPRASHPHNMGLRAWTGGHFTEPNEQNTQQSPGFGRSSVLQCSHS
jgi:hypothetical protein